MDNSQFIGKICPYCRSEFKENDEIVSCSECDMPHHKECWIENQGCTTFGCLGTIQTPNMSAQNDLIFCTRCGHQNSMANTFCSACGHKLFIPILQSPAQQISPLSQPLNTFTQQLQPENQLNSPIHLSRSSTSQPDLTYQQHAAAFEQLNPQIPRQSTSSTPLAQQAHSAAQLNAASRRPAYPTQQIAPSVQARYSTANPATPNSQQASPQFNAHIKSFLHHQEYLQQKILDRLQETNVLERSFIQENADYYISKFNSMRVQSIKVIWNWAAFLLSFFWLFHRKMYLLGSAILAASLIFVFIKPIALSLGLYLALSIILGLMGNYFYMKHVTNETNKLQMIPITQRSGYINKKGGTNVALPLAIFAVILVGGSIALIV